MGDAVVVVRPYRAEDRDALLRLAPGVASWRPADGVRDAARAWVREAADGAGRDDHAVFVAELDSRVVGFAGVGESRHFAGDRDAYLGELVVDPAARRRGVARALVEQVRGWAAQRGLVRLTLDTGWANAEALGFYAALGFETEQVRLSRPVREV